jgi:methylmalonyl-CoA/ethylmalonyl-CoA epimerase
MSFFQCGDIRLLIGAQETVTARGGTILYFKVGNIKETHALLKDQGVEFVAEPHLVAKMPDHELWIGFLKDPDDNVLAVMSEVPYGGAGTQV